MKDPDTGHELTREQILEIENRWLAHNLAMLCHQIEAIGNRAANGEISHTTAVENSTKIAVATSARLTIFTKPNTYAAS